MCTCAAEPCGLLPLAVLPKHQGLGSAHSSSFGWSASVYAPGTHSSAVLSLEWLLRAHATDGQVVRSRL